MTWLSVRSRLSTRPSQILLSAPASVPALAPSRLSSHCIEPTSSFTARPVVARSFHLTSHRLASASSSVLTPIQKMTWTSPEPASVPAPAVMVPMDTQTFADVAAYKPVHLHLDWHIDWDARIISGKVFHEIEVLRDGVSTVTLDASYLEIDRTDVDGTKVEAKLGERRQTLGSPLEIPVGSRSKGDRIKIDIAYSTTMDCTALGWLAKEQTAGKTNPFLYSQCQAIHCRSLIPCIDSPSHKVVYTSTVRSRIPVLMSALKDESKAAEAGVYHFRQPIGIPSYLIAIVGGDLEFRKLGERTGIWAEPPMADAVQWEFEADAERFLEHAEKVISPYSWTRYDSVVLPPSFPYGGMENANLTTLTPTLVAGDRSLTDVLLHELCHSWSGNLTSCSNWTHFWLNEGWCVYLERLLLQSVHGEKEGPAHRAFSYIIGSKALKDALEQFQDTPRFQRLIPLYKDGEDPDDAFSSLPYEKGSNFLLYLERTVGGLDNFLPYAKSYFHAFFDRSVSTEEWQQHLFDFYKGSDEITAKLKQVEWDAWFHGEGLELPVKMEYDTTLAEQAFSLAACWAKVVAGTSTVDKEQFSPSDIKGFNANQVVVFLERLHSGPKIPLAVTTQLDAVYGFSTASNPEVLLRFFEVALEVEGGEYAQKAAQWVKGVGRMKFCRTIFRALNKVEPELAKKTFLDNKSFYHPIAAAQIEKDLGLSTAITGSDSIYVAGTEASGQTGPASRERWTDATDPDDACSPPVQLDGDMLTIFGSTGTGKTKLSVEIAKAISAHAATAVVEGGPGEYGEYRSAEVISCDSMQIYRGLDIITNKATEEEMQGIPHHLIGFLEPGQEYDVAQFIRDVRKLHAEFRAREEKTLTVMAGGTTYYLQHLLFPGRLVTSSDEAKLSGDDDPTTITSNSASKESADPDLVAHMSRLSPEEQSILEFVSHKSTSKQLITLQNTNPLAMWKLLDKLDPEMAARWHWKDSRKVGNSLRVVKETGRRHSHWIARQDDERRHRHGRDEAQSSTPVDGLRRLLFWVWCEPETLKRRLDDRVDEMVERGLLDEIREMRRIAKSIFDDLSAGSETRQNYQTGIFQTIGYKQFDAYLSRLEELDGHFRTLEEANRTPGRHFDDEVASRLFEQAKEKTQQHTRRYAKDQVKWIQNKLIPEVRLAQTFMRQAKERYVTGARGDDVQLYLLDATDPSQWRTKVLEPALSIVRLFLKHQPPPDPRNVSSPEVASNLFSGRSENAALSRHLPTDTETEAGKGTEEEQGMRSLDANRMYVCSVCTTHDDEPHFVRCIERRMHEKSKGHRMHQRAKVSEERRREIEQKKKAGEDKRRLREALKAEIEEVKQQQQTQTQVRSEE